MEVEVDEWGGVDTQQCSRSHSRSYAKQDVRFGSFTFLSTSKVSLCIWSQTVCVGAPLLIPIARHRSIAVLLKTFSSHFLTRAIQVFYLFLCKVMQMARSKSCCHGSMLPKFRGVVVLRVMQSAVHCTSYPSATWSFGALPSRCILSSLYRTRAQCSRVGCWNPNTIYLLKELNLHEKGKSKWSQSSAYLLPFLSRSGQGNPRQPVLPVTDTKALSIRPIGTYYR